MIAHWLNPIRYICSGLISYCSVTSLIYATILSYPLSTSAVLYTGVPVAKSTGNQAYLPPHRSNDHLSENIEYSSGKSASRANKSASLDHTPWSMMIHFDFSVLTVGMRESELVIIVLVNLCESLYPLSLILDDIMPHSERSGDELISIDPIPLLRGGFHLYL